MPGYIAIDPDTDRRVRAEVVKRLADRSKENFAYYLANFPGIKGKSGRERLAFYRSKDERWLMEVYATFPLETVRLLLRDWMALSKQYGPPMGVPVAV